MKKWRCKICGYIHSGETPPEQCPVCGAEAGQFEPEEDVQRQAGDRTVKKIIIIGNGAAGMEAARTLREKSSAVEILVFSDESYQFYSRIHLSSLLGEEVKRENLFIYPDSWYREQRIQVLLQTPVMKINPEEQTISDVFGKTYSYDRLIIATGAQPFIPPIKGKDLEGVFSLRNLFDALQIRQFAKTCQQVAVIGGGILGVEAASGLQKIGLSVTLVEIADHLMPLQLDRDCGALLQQVLERRGIKVETGKKVLKILGKIRAEKVVLENGESLPAEMVLLSTGISPNTQLASEAGIAVKRGILVNNHLQTNFPEIFAAGDVAEFGGAVFGIWPAAVEQGSIAAQNALGIPVVYSGTNPLHILKVAGTDMTAIGQKYAREPNQKEIRHLNRKEGQYAKLVHDGEHLLGAIVMGIGGVGFRLEKIMKKRRSIREMIPELEKGNWEVLRKK